MFAWKMDAKSGIPLTEQLYAQIRREIEEGTLAAESRLPARRQMAEQLGISQTTVENALGRLLEEGYIQSRPRSGLYVSPGQMKGTGERETSVPVQWDFGTGAMDARQFPYTVWAHFMREVMSEQREELLLAGDPRGSLPLRREISGMLRRVRDIGVDPEQVIVGAGTEDLVRQVLSLLGQGLFAVEDPGYPTIRRALVGGGGRIAPVPLADGAMDVRELYRSGADAAYVTPGHQFPTGHEMDEGQREALLTWAREGNAYLLEDDFDSEFRYREEQYKPLFARDPERVIYFNTFARTLAPGLRIAYMLLPKALSSRYSTMFGSCQVSCFEQETLAKMMAEGNFERHLNRMRTIYRGRLKALQDEIQKSELGQLMPCSAGLYAVLEPAGNMPSDLLCTSARKKGVRVTRLSDYGVMRRNPQMERSVLLGFSGMDEESLRAGIRMLKEAWIPRVR